MSESSPRETHELHGRELRARDATELAAGPPSELVAFAASEADPFAASAFDADDGSVPPMGDLDTEFFERGSDSWAPPAELFEADPTPPNPRLIALKSMTARRRRAQFAKYVTAAVGMCGIVCLTAMVKLVVSRAAGTDESDEPALAHAVAVAETPSRSAMAAVGAAAPQAPAETLSPAVVAPAEPVAAAVADPVPSALPAAGSPPAADPAPAPVASASPPTGEPQAAPVAAAPTGPSADNAVAANDAPPANAAAAGAAPTGDSAAEAAAAREVARTELSRGHARQSIEAGERSVALDPTDGEAWLVLGAAYQSRGAVADARRCFKACVSQAKRGPRGECSAMLR
ncbi:MAG TPA: hypothetical protein VK841_08345 [Polyangiaceae bacterium]|jgi:hypothetical protein|nr:hypothetical protein [Polyangiaceae bacterium]